MVEKFGELRPLVGIERNENKVEKDRNITSRMYQDVKSTPSLRTTLSDISVYMSFYCIYNSQGLREVLML